AIMAGSNVAAQRGILIRDGVALEKAGRITGVAFDKTGTLTFGKPSVAKAWTTAVPALAPTADLAAALARHSLHPISQAIAKTSSVDLDFTDWREVHGAGVEGRLVQGPKSKVQSREREKAGEHGEVDDAEVSRLGSLRWLKESGVDLGAGETFIKEWVGQGA